MSRIVKQCVGIDISKTSFHVCVSQLEEDQTVRFSQGASFENNKKGFNQLDKWVKKQIDKKVAVVYLMEATGVYYEALAYHLYEIKKTVHVVLPNKAKHYLASLNWKTKTDAVDAKGLAQFGVERKFRPWQPPKGVYRRLKDLTRHRTRLQEMKTSLRNQLSALDCKAQEDSLIRKSLEQLIGELEQQVLESEAAIKAIIQEDTLLSKKMSYLTSITGIGLISAAVIVAESGGFEHFKSIKQLVSFAGLDVIQRQSGSSLKGKGRISKKGNAHIRRVLYFPAISAVQHSATFQRLYARLVAQGKPKKVALVAVQRKLLALTFTLWKKECCFVENYQSSTTNKIASATAEATLDSTY